MVNINELVLSVILACLALIFLKYSLFLNVKYSFWCFVACYFMYKV